MNLVLINKSAYNYLHDVIDNVRICNHHMYQIVKYLVDHYGWKYCIWEKLTENKNDIEKYFKNEYDKVPKNILSIDYSKQLLDFDFPPKINLYNMSDDTIFGKKTNQYKTKCWNKCKAIFSTYGYNIQKKMPKVKSDHIVYLPHSVYYQSEFNKNPQNKLFVGGHIKNYPPREYLYKLSKTKEYNNLIESYRPGIGYKVEKYNKKKVIFGQAFVDKMSEYLVCFTDDVIGLDKKLIEECGGNGYIVAKHFEILGSGSLLMSFNERTKDMFELIGFIDGKHYISVTYENIIDKLEYILDPKNRKEIDKIRKCGQEFAIKNHNYKVRADYIQQWVTDKSKLDLKLHYNKRYDTHFILGYK